MTTQKEEGWQGMEFNVEPKDMEFLMRSYVGRVIDIHKIPYLQDIFQMEGFKPVKVTPMGENLVLISPMEGEDVFETLKGYEEWLEIWFQSVLPWSPEILVNRRFIWLRIFGAPLIAWKEDFFSMIVQPLGTFVSLDEATRLMEKLTLEGF